MFQKKRQEVVSPSARPSYAVPQDFCRIFTEDQTALYLLSLLLTADSEKAERCFVAGLEGSIQGNAVFKEWARSWSKRTIIKNAVRMILPAPTSSSPTFPAQGQSSGTRHVSDKNVPEAHFGGSLASVLRLAALERFVFVMSILEGYSIPECSILLNCTKQEVTTAQARALQQMALAGINPPTSVPGTEDSRLAHFLEPLHAA
jgi:hypothetical protein